ncbi:MBL fold metallo-hydrolase [Deinococcus sp. PESE-13]
MSPAFVGLGGTDEVGASSYLHLLKEGHLLIDAGARPGALGDAALPQLGLLSEHPPTAMILTHAHLDHVGALPVVIRCHPRLHIDSLVCPGPSPGDHPNRHGQRPVAPRPPDGLTRQMT